MKIENTGIDNKVIDIVPLNHIMGKHAFILGESWDYERVTYDYKINSQEKNVTYYIRIQGEAIEGDVDKKDAVIKLKTPLLGKHYYPHGIEYGEDENFPKNLIERANKIVTGVNEELESFLK
ncbi:YugN family protein [Pseudogracilibacillus sp. SO30301A]|uniref:YugN family protein n=1 Tax=Pseudogracilibacillus sp. SO30301A TaxID=3098291 RepID=UPI00300E4F86